MLKSVISKRLLSTVALMHLACVSLMPHSGHTDGAGGHWNRRSGTYHYHNGGPAYYRQMPSEPYGNRIQTNTADPSLEYPKENAIAAACGLLFAVVYRRYRKQ